ncbi:MAG: superoxide dismutase [Flavobacteriia bacterium]|nr:superoxide dismutase [Flavobacteriia bacterium]
MFTLPNLPYAYSALEPHIDAQTMEIHHSKHHQAYINNLNAAIEGTPMAGKSIDALITEHADVPAVRNNGGGHWNHSMFWTVMTPNGGGEPEGELSEAISAAFGSYEDFKAAFAKAAATRFGSGWAWLCVNKGGRLEVCSTANQDNPLMPGVGCEGTPKGRRNGKMPMAKNPIIRRVNFLLCPSKLKKGLVLYAMHRVVFMSCSRA